jgi:hypothetical protein
MRRFPGSALNAISGLGFTDPSLGGEKMSQLKAE